MGRPASSSALYAPAARRVPAPRRAACASRRWRSRVPALAARARRRLRLHAAARRGRLPAADDAAARGVARGGRSPQPPRRGRAARVPRGGGRRAPHRPRRAHRGPDAAHHVGRARRARSRTARASLDGARGGDARGARDGAGRVGAVHDAARHADRRGPRRHAGRPLGARSSAPISTSWRGSPREAQAIMRDDRRHRGPARRAADRPAAAARRDRPRGGRRASGSRPATSSARCASAWSARRPRRSGSASAASTSSCACRPGAQQRRGASATCGSTATTARASRSGSSRASRRRSRPAPIRREAGSRRIAVEAQRRGPRPRRRRRRGPRAPGRRAARCRPGYFVDVGGRVESQARAARSLTARDRRRGARRVRAALPRARLVRRDGRHPGHAARRVRRRHRSRC